LQHPLYPILRKVTRVPEHLEHPTGATRPAAPAPLLLGRHLLNLGVPPGPQMGVILKAVYERQLDGDVRTLEDAIAMARRMI